MTSLKPQVDQRCEHCGFKLDEDRKVCSDCEDQLKRDKAEAEFWKEKSREAYVTSQYNEDSV